MARRKSKAFLTALVFAMVLGACQKSPLQELEDIEDAVLDAEYSSTLESMVLVGRSLWIASLDGEATEVELPWDGCSVSVLGEYAAVSHDGFFSIVDLDAGVVEDTKEVELRCPEILLGPDHVYLLDEGRLSQISYYAPRSTLELEMAFRSGTDGRGEIHKSNRRIYGTVPGSAKTQRYDLEEDGSPKDSRERTSIYHYDHPVCPGIWLSPDGERMFNACGPVYTTRGKRLEPGRHHENPSKEYDQIYLGRLPLGNRLRSLCDNGRVVVAIPDEETIGGSKREKDHLLKDLAVYDPTTSPILIFGSENLEPISELTVPTFPAEEGATVATTRAEYAFCLDSERAAVVVREGEREDRWGVVSIRFAG